LLVVGDWNQYVGFYLHENGHLTHKTEKQLDYDPMAVYLFNNGAFFLAIGSNKKLNLHTKDGLFLPFALSSFFYSLNTIVGENRWGSWGDGPT
jgi:hypothetical protein